MRKGWAIVLNLAVPGSGLIVLRREWLGLAAAALFGILAQVALLGLLLLPATIPAWLTTLSVSLALFVWLGAQWLLWMRWRTATGPGMERQLSALCERAADALSRQAFAEAAEILEVALTVNDEDLAVNVKWAELMTVTGQFPKARQAWRRILSLDRSGDARRLALEALAALPEE